MGSTQSKNASGTPRPTRPSNERRKSSKRQQATAEPAKPAPGSIRGTFTAAIDQGTTSSRFIIFDKDGKPQAIHQMEFPQLYPRAGWIEQDPYDILNSVTTCMARATELFVDGGHVVEDIKAIGVTNQRETTLVWDKVTGKPLYNAIVWSDTRTKRLVHEMKKKPGAEKLREMCGIPLSTYPSCLKLLWMIRNVPKVQEAHRAGNLCFGTVDTWLLYKLTGGAEKGGVYVTDPTNASRTMFCNIQTLEYDDFLIDFFGVRGTNFPKIVPSSDPDEYGSVANGPLKGVRIAGCLGDQSAALVGQQAFYEGMAKNTYGTGCFLLYNTGNDPVISQNGLLTTVAYSFKGRKPVYALEGSIAVAGSAIKFLRDNLGIIQHSHEVGELASRVKDSGKVVFVTAFSGLFAPYWCDEARGTIFGMTQYTTKEHIARATLEAPCFQTRAILEAMERDSGKTLQMLTVDGGMSNSDIAMQTQADIMGIEVDRPEMRETTALGAAIAAGFALGVWHDFDELKNINRDNRVTFHPQSTLQQRESSYTLWQRAIELSKGWLDNESPESEEDEGY